MNTLPVLQFKKITLHEYSVDECEVKNDYENIAYCEREKVLYHILPILTHYVHRIGLVSFYLCGPSREGLQKIMSKMNLNIFLYLNLKTESWKSRES